MSQAVRKRSERPSRFTDGVIYRLKEGVMITLGGVAMFLLVSLLTYHPADNAWSQAGENLGYHNLGGAVGAWFSDFSLYFFGKLAFLFPVSVGYLGWLTFKEGLEGFFLNRYHALVRFVGLI